MKKLVRILCAALTAALVSSLISCSGIGASKNGKTVMKIGSREVSYDVYRFAVLTEKDSMKIKYGGGLFDGDEDEAVTKELRERTDLYLKNMYAIPALAADYGVSEDDQAIKSLAAERKASDVAASGGEDGFKKELELSNMTEHVYDVMNVFTVMSDETFNAMLREGAIDDDPDHVREYLMSDNCVRILEVLISKERHADAEAREIAERVRDAARSGGDPADGDVFYDLVMEYGENIDMFNNPDGYYMMRGVWNKDIEDAAFSLAVGEISDVIETPRGFSVLLRLEKSEEYVDRRFESLKKDYLDSVFALAKEEKAASLKVETEELYDSTDVWKMK